jgi:hypothetical protein
MLHPEFFVVYFKIFFDTRYFYISLFETEIASFSYSTLSKRKKEYYCGVSR